MPDLQLYWHISRENILSGLIQYLEDLQYSIRITKLQNWGGDLWYLVNIRAEKSNLLEKPTFQL